MSSVVDLHNAYVRGDLEAVRRALGNPPGFPNVTDECGGTCLEYALYHSPLSLVRELLDLGADPNYEAPDGFPSLFAAISSNHADRAERVALLLDHGADIQVRGVNDYTPLHFAATQDEAACVKVLLARGADPEARTRIDHYATPLEEAEFFGHEEGAKALKKFAGKPSDGGSPRSRVRREERR